MHPSRQLQVLQRSHLSNATTPALRQHNDENHTKNSISTPYTTFTTDKAPQVRHTQHLKPINGDFDVRLLASFPRSPRCEIRPCHCFLPQKSATTSSHHSGFALVGDLGRGEECNRASMASSGQLSGEAVTSGGVRSLSASIFGKLQSLKPLTSGGVEVPGARTKEATSATPVTSVVSNRLLPHRAEDTSSIVAPSVSPSGIPLSNNTQVVDYNEQKQADSLASLVKLQREVEFLELEQQAMLLSWDTEKAEMLFGWLLDRKRLELLLPKQEATVCAESNIFE